MCLKFQCVSMVSMIFGVAILPACGDASSSYEHESREIFGPSGSFIIFEFVYRHSMFMPCGQGLCSSKPSLRVLFGLTSSPTFMAPVEGLSLAQAEFKSPWLCATTHVQVAQLTRQWFAVLPWWSRYVFQ